MASPDKELKKMFLKETAQDPERYYPTKVLLAKGFVRGTCSSCGKHFWAVTKTRQVCGDATCSDGFSFFEQNPSREALDYVMVWKRFKTLMEKRGYTAIERYPVIARWRNDTDFVQASIYDFQPYVVSGAIEPPANPLVVPQFCLRFNDIDNVGITMSHMTGFIMIGQHTFVPEKEWNQDKLFEDIYAWLTEGIGLPKEEIIFHEDAWAGGGNFGPCIEFFSRGCELGNQVYMLFEQTADGKRKDIPLKVLDMGMGQERVAWFSQGVGTIYDAAFPTVMAKLYERTGIKRDEKLLRAYLPHAGNLNYDEQEDINHSWDEVAKKLGYTTTDLKNTITPLAALYSVAEHARTLLVAISDGGLPSNVGGGYNLRIILRRALQFIDTHNWDISLGEVCAWHAAYLFPLFPELSKNLDDVQKILSFEKEKWIEAKKRHQHLVKKIVEKGETLSIAKLIELYDSHGVSPEELIKVAKAQGKIISVPDNFYTLVAERHETAEQKTATKKDITLPVENLPATTALYFEHYDQLTCKGTVLKIIGEHVILDQTVFYPTSGGQVHDEGTMQGCAVVDVFKQATPQGTIIIHKLAQKPTFSVGDQVECSVACERRIQLAQHHTATHLITGAARRVLGNHIWQAGAAKTTEKSRLDLTHYEQLTLENLQEIEDLANKIIDENRPVHKTFLDRRTAEAEYGFRLYQGGAVPGKHLRIVNIEGFDVEACGGTHVDVTGDIGHVKILRTSKIQDGVVRIEFVAGNAADKTRKLEEQVLGKAQEILGGSQANLPSRATELFDQWKKARKGRLETFTLKADQSFSGDVVTELARILRTQPEHIIKTLERFQADITASLARKVSGKKSKQE